MGLQTKTEKENLRMTEYFDKANNNMLYESDKELEEKYKEFKSRNPNVPFFKGEAGKYTDSFMKATATQCQRKEKTS